MIGCVRIDIGFIYLYIYGKIGVEMLFLLLVIIIYFIEWVGILN